ncbi:MAG: hypothetical protein D6711_15815 [Chloroflexi bacterium]|nr:MAG: hypothetical protein D6711_15815 [Chloroflexota bacterium]
MKFVTVLLYHKSWLLEPTRMLMLLRILIFMIVIMGIGAHTDDAFRQAQPTERPFQPVNLPTATPAPQVCPELENPYPQHTVVADINYLAHTVWVQQRIRYANTTGESLTQLVFNIEANRWQNVFFLNRVADNFDDLLYTLNNKRLVVDLMDPLPPNCVTNILLEFQIQVPLIGLEVYSPKGYLGYTDRQMNLGHWLPTVAPYQNGEWVTRPPVLVGEQEILEIADWVVMLNLVEPPPNLVVAAPGQITQISPTSWRYEHHASREFSLSLSDQFVLHQAEDEHGVQVEVYCFNTPELQPAGEHALDVATQSLSVYSDLFGQYPYERLVVVQGDFPDGMEFSGIVYVGDAWFTRWDGTPTSYLTLITAHEVSHQWWYARVGNDAAFHPWLDEALATYSEYVYLEEYYPDLRDWWWAFRVDVYEPEGAVNSTVYEFSSAREYINAVYLRGVRMLHELRQDLGTQAFFQLLADYAFNQADRIASPDDFWHNFTPEQLELTAVTRSRYLRPETNN